MSDERRQQLDYDLADVVAADTPARLKALGHPLRSLLVDLVLERAMTVTELAELVGKPRGSVAHHVDVLVDAGMLRVVRTRRVRALEERFYGRTGRTIVFQDSVREGHDLPFVADARREIDLDAPDDTPGGFTYRHARIPAELAAEFTERVMALALEFAQLPRGGTREFGFLVGVFPTNRLPSRGGSTGPERASADTPSGGEVSGGEVSGGKVSGGEVSERDASGEGPARGAGAGPARRRSRAAPAGATRTSTGATDRQAAGRQPVGRTNRAADGRSDSARTRTSAGETTSRAARATTSGRTTGRAASAPTGRAEGTTTGRAADRSTTTRASVRTAPIRKDRT